jgi:hypothetical protein
VIAKKDLKVDQWYDGLVFVDHKQRSDGTLCWDGECFHNPNTESEYIWVYRDAAAHFKYQFEPNVISKDPERGSSKKRATPSGTPSAGGGEASQYQGGSREERGKNPVHGHGDMATETSERSLT